MAVNRFFNPYVYTPQSQFVPTELPFSIMERALASKQAQQDKAIADEYAMLNLKPAGIESVQMPTGEIFNLGEKSKSYKKINEFNQKLREFSSKPLDRTTGDYYNQILDLRKEYGQLSKDLEMASQREAGYAGLAEQMGKQKDLNQSPWLATSYVEQLKNIMGNKSYVPQESVNYGTYVDRQKKMIEAISQMETNKKAWSNADNKGYIKSGDHEFRTAKDIDYAATLALKNNGVLQDIVDQANFMDKYGNHFQSADEKKAWIDSTAQDLVNQMIGTYKTDKYTSKLGTDATFRYFDKLKRETEESAFSTVGATQYKLSEVPYYNDVLADLTTGAGKSKTLLDKAATNVAEKKILFDKGLISAESYQQAISEQQSLQSQLLNASTLAQQELAAFKKSNIYQSGLDQVNSNLKKIQGDAISFADAKQMLNDPIVSEALSRSGINVDYYKKQFAVEDKAVTSNVQFKFRDEVKKAGYKLNSEASKVYSREATKAYSADRTAQSTYPVVSFAATKENRPLVSGIKSMVANNPQSVVAKLGDTEIDASVLFYNDMDKNGFSVHYDPNVPNQFYLQVNASDDNTFKALATQKIYKDLQAKGMDFNSMAGSKELNNAIAMEAANMKSRGEVVKVSFDQGNQLGMSLAAKVASDPSYDESTRAAMSQVVTKNATNLSDAEPIFNLANPGASTIFTANIKQPNGQVDRYMFNVTKGDKSKGVDSYSEVMQPTRNANGQITGYAPIPDVNGNPKRFFFNDFGGFMQALSSGK